MKSRTRILGSAVVALLLGIYLTGASRAETSAAPDAAATPGLALSDKPPQGCCCISTQSPPRPSDCFIGLQQDKCKTAGEVFKQYATTTWTPGKCAGSP